MTTDVEVSSLPEVPQGTALVEDVPSTNSRTTTTSPQTKNGFQVFLNTTWISIRRAFMWNLTSIQTTDYEEGVILSKSRSHAPPQRQQNLEAWRRSVIMVALPTVALALPLALFELWKGLWKDVFNSLGMFTLILRPLALILEFMFACVSICHWNSYEKSSRFLAIGWAGSLILSLWYVVIPVNFLLKSEALEMYDFQGNSMAVKIVYGVYSIFQVLPLLVTIPMGMIQASLCIKTLLPETTIPGLFILSVAPFSSIIFLAMGVMISQVSEDPLVMIGMLLLVSVPIIRTLRPKLYTSPMSDVISVQLGRTQLAIEVFQNLGCLCLVIWATKKHLFLSAAQVCRFFLEFFGQRLLSTVFFADRLYNISIGQLLSKRKAMQDSQWTELDALMNFHHSRFPEYQVRQSNVHRSVNLNEPDLGSSAYTSRAPNQAMNTTDRDLGTSAHDLGASNTTDQDLESRNSEAVNKDVNKKERDSESTANDLETPNKENNTTDHDFDSINSETPNKDVNKTDLDSEFNA